MARLVGVDLPREKRLEIALTYVYGIGRTRAAETLAQTGVSADVRVRDLGDEDLVKLRDWIEANYKIEGDLRREVAQAITLPCGSVIDTMVLLNVLLIWA